MKLTDRAMHADKDGTVTLEECRLSCAGTGRPASPKYRTAASRTSIADEMREKHRRLVLVNNIHGQLDALGRKWRKRV